VIRDANVQSPLQFPAAVQPASGVQHEPRRTTNRKGRGSVARALTGLMRHELVNNLIAAIYERLTRESIIRWPRPT